MSNLQNLLDEKWPITKGMDEWKLKLYTHNRKYFTEGYNAAKEDNLKHYGNTLLVSVASEANEKGQLASDFMLEGQAEKVGSALALQMQRHPELLEFIEYSLQLYDLLIADTAKNQ